MKDTKKRKGNECGFFSQFQNDLPLSANSKKFSPKTVPDQLFVQVIALFFDNNKLDLYSAKIMKYSKALYNVRLKF